MSIELICIACGIGSLWLIVWLYDVYDRRKN